MMSYHRRIPYQYLRHFNPLQNLATPLLQMQAQRDERSIIQKFLITVTALVSHQIHKMCDSQGVMCFKFIQPSVARSD